MDVLTAPDPERLEALLRPMLRKIREATRLDRITARLEAVARRRDAEAHMDEAFLQVMVRANALVSELTATAVVLQGLTSKNVVEPLLSNLRVNIAQTLTRRAEMAGRVAADAVTKAQVVAALGPVTETASERDKRAVISVLGLIDALCAPDEGAGPEVEGLDPVEVCANALYVIAGRAVRDGHMSADDLAAFLQREFSPENLAADARPRTVN